MEEKIKKDQYEFDEEIKKEKKEKVNKDRISYLRMKEELIKSIEQNKKGHIEYLERWLEQEESPENEGKVNKDRIEYLEKLIEDVKAGKVDPQGQEMKDLEAEMLSDIDRHIEGTP